MSEVTVCIPTIPPRRDMLVRAVASVAAQTAPCNLVVVNDTGRRGAAATRDAALRQVASEWVAFLDDDDEFLPGHVASLLAHARVTGADLVYSNFFVPESPGFLLESFASGPWDPENPRQTTVTTLCRTRVAQRFGFTEGGDFGDFGDGNRMGEDWWFTSRINAAGYRIAHLEEPTWLWHHHGGNLSGLPTW